MQLHHITRTIAAIGAVALVAAIVLAFTRPFNGLTLVLSLVPLAAVVAIVVLGSARMASDR